MKKLYFLFFLTIGLLANAQIINFPDANFKINLLSANTNNNIAKNLNGEFFKIDSNNDGEIQEGEALNVSYLDLNAYRCGNGCVVSSIEGINNFINLKVLKCFNNDISNLDISNLINLEELICYNNDIGNLDLNNCINLKKIDCSNNLFSSLNLLNLQQLVELRVNSNVNLNQLLIDNLINLEILSCAYNSNLTNLSLDGLVRLKILFCNNNRLSQIDFSDLILIEEIGCQNNYYMQEIDVSNNFYLKKLYLFNVYLNYLNIKNGSILEQLQLPTIDNLKVCMDEFEIGNYYFGINTLETSYCSFTPGGTFYEISGNTKLDSNNNGCDVLDIDYSNLRFNITDGTVTGSLIANQTGNYYIPVSAGNHTITPNLENPSYFNVLPTNFTVDFPTQASPFTQDFCVTANGVHHDVEVVLIPTVPARPGFDANYKLVYRNKGNQVENGSISLTFDDDKLDYVSSNPVYNSTAVNNFTWNYTNLQPFETREIALVLNVNSPMEIPAVNIGDQINFLAEITPFANDEVQYDNIFALKQIVVGSYDPNDKTCIQGETITPTEVGNYAHYVIRFENTGTFPAENIVVKDMIDLAKFDIATLVPLKSSHDFYTRINGNKVEFIFENINLDFNDATNDGYVVFKIKTKPTLIVGDTFTNNANIYFDYNFPITTNTYSTTITALSSQDFDFGTYFTLYPNPAKDILNIQSKQDVAINSVEIYNQLGQIVMASTNTLNTIDVSNLASGTYFVKINTEKGSANAKFVKE